MSYSEEDLIWSVKDERVTEAANKEVFYSNNPNTCLQQAEEGVHCGILREIREDSIFPFLVACEGSDSHLSVFSNIIIKKEEKKKYLPYDLSDVKVRNYLRDRWICGNDIECRISYFVMSEPEVWLLKVGASFYTGEELLYEFVFLGTGDPVGERVV